MRRPRRVLRDGNSSRAWKTGDRREASRPHIARGDWHPACDLTGIAVRFFHFDHAFRAARPRVADPVEGHRIEVRGVVQGVGFRPWVYRMARAHHVAGRVRNHTGGVTIEAFGTHAAVQRFLDQLATAPPPAARIEQVTDEPIPAESPDGFQIVESEGRADRRVSIPPDLPTCPECLAEIRDPANRRYGYPFTNCTNCGPRFTIAIAAPYDRPNTTMARFAMCAACRREYDDVDDRRFHAQPNACPACGPVLRAVTAAGVPVETGDPLAAAAATLRAGGIVALKGIGGFHLACDATSAPAVAALRARKRRDEKPFAVMACDVEHARRLGVIGEEEARLLSSPERPVVLVERREPSALAANVAPHNPLVGLLLPYTPLHHLLLDRVAAPLVMTSGNLSEEPIAVTNDEALARLGGIADLLLLHDREIVTRCDDSVARLIAARPVVLRRSRGYVPRAIRLARPLDRPILACGALLKNTFCLARHDEACLGPHIGDLENVESYAAYRDAIERLERFLDIRPEVIAHDLHPDYLSTHYALERTGARTVAVQHHHAHVASVMAEHGLEGPVIGIAYDGTGLGTDGTAWGGEILVADYARAERHATFRPVPLAGGDAAIRQPWRTALALLDDAFDGDAPVDALRLFAEVPARDVLVVRRMIRDGLNVTSAHGVGRYFDALGAEGLVRPRASYAGQLALEWNAAAERTERGRYRFEIARGRTPWQVDLRHAVRDAVFELIGGEPAGRVSARFHNTLVAATAAIVRGVGATCGRLPVALSGGCFQNAWLAEGVMRELSPEYAVYVPARVPPGDGGLALGQVVVADAVARQM
jgi:hydrogenase maturation protein HypF